MALYPLLPSARNMIFFLGGYVGCVEDFLILTTKKNEGLFSRDNGLLPGYYATVVVPLTDLTNQLSNKKQLK